MATRVNHTVILGAGIIGVSTAYYLSLSRDTPAEFIHLVEASTELFASASGYSGGFLAKDWFSPPTASLGALSFELHKQLAEEHNGFERWGYSRSTATSLANLNSSSEATEDWLTQGGSRTGAASNLAAARNPDRPAWLVHRQGEQFDVISSENTVAQVDPFRLCKFLLGESLDRGVRLHQPAQALSISTNSQGELSSVKISAGNDEITEVPCSRLVITAGAWSPHVFSTLFPKSRTKIPIEALSGHSLVLRSSRWNSGEESKGCHAIFATDPTGYSAEAFSRIGGEIYLAGVNDASFPLPKLATDSTPDSDSMQKLKNTARTMFGFSPDNKEVEIVREGLCFRPITHRGPPIVSRVVDSMLGSGISTRGGGEGGVFLSAGHGPWGIAQSVGTGKVLSEMIEGKPTSANVKGLKLQGGIDWP